MRWVALILLLGNAGLAIWQFAGTPGGGADERPLAPEIGDLSLLREPEQRPGANADTECFSIGPFDDEAAAEAAGERLAALGTDPALRRLVDEETYGFQVMLPPFPDREAAVEATRALAEQGIQDYFIVTEDETYQNAVSLGVFSERRYALDHQRYLAEIGFDAELRVRTREQARYWQDYRDPAGQVQPEQIAARVGDGPLQRLPRPCS